MKRWLTLAITLAMVFASVAAISAQAESPKGFEPVHHGDEDDGDEDDGDDSSSANADGGSGSSANGGNGGNGGDGGDGGSAGNGGNGGDGGSAGNGGNGGDGGDGGDGSSANGGDGGDGGNGGDGGDGGSAGNGGTVWVVVNGGDGRDGRDGQDGRDGRDGRNGEDGRTRRDGRVFEASSYLNPDVEAATVNRDVDSDSSCDDPDQDDDQRLSPSGTNSRSVHNGACLFDRRGNNVDAPVSWESTGVGSISSCPDPDGPGPKTATLTGNRCYQTGSQSIGLAGDGEYHVRLDNSTTTGEQDVTFCLDPENNGCDDADALDAIEIDWTN